MVDVSVVVPTSDSKQDLAGLFDSLDRQSMPVSRFEVLAASHGSGDGTDELLDKLAGHRPNVTKLAHVHEGDEAWLAPCSGTYVLRLDPRARLFPEALERLYGFAAEHDLDAVAGRVTSPTAATPALLLQDDPAVDESALAAVLAGPALLVRRTRLSGDNATDRALAVGVLGSYPTLSSPASVETSDDALAWRQERIAAVWQSGRLRVEAAGSFDGHATLNGDEALTVLVRSATSGLSYVVPVEGQVTTDGIAPASWSLLVELDPATAALGTPLTHDTWELDVQLSGHGVPAHSVLTLGSAACPPALLPLGPVVVGSQQGRLQVDVGPTKHPLLADVDPAWATITETAGGSVLVLQLPEMSVVADAPELEGYVALGSFRLRAGIANDGERAWLRCYLSGLAGVSEVNAMFGDCPAKPTGLELRISDLGAMTIAKKQPPAPKPAPAAPKPPAATKLAPAAGPAQQPTATKPATTKTATKEPATKKVATKKVATKKVVKQASGPVARLRRAVPAPLEPAIRRLSAVPAARDWYRRLTKL